MLIETSPPNVTSEMTTEIADHLRLSTGAALDQSEAAKTAFLGSVAHLESLLGLCLAPRSFTWTGRLSETRSANVAMGPVRGLTLVERVALDGSKEAMELSLFRLDRGSVRTRVCASVHVRSTIEITFDAGFGETWSETPSDLKRAALMLTASLFDRRHAAGDMVRETPYGVASLIQPWRPLRLSAGVA